MSTPTTHQTGLTDSDVNTPNVNTHPLQGASAPLEDPATAGMPAPAREATPPNHAEPDIGPGVSTPPATPPVNTPSDTEGDPFELTTAWHREIEAGSDGADQDTAEGTEKSTSRDEEEAPEGGVRERICALADRWGLDLIPPSLADEGLPPLNHAKSWAERGDQAPATGPTRIAYKTWEATTRAPRYVLAGSYHVLARPGRTAVAFVVLALLLRVPGVQDALAIAFALTDAITYYTGLQWVLGLT